MTTDNLSIVRAVLTAKCKGIFVDGAGAMTHKLWIVGEALGAEEERLREPFVGPSGRLLEQIMLSAGVLRDACYITNVAPVRPPNNDFDRLPETGLTLDECKWYLGLKIAAFRPNCILALGNRALEALCGESGITEWRGSILPSTICESVQVKVVPSFHPAMILYMTDESARKERESKAKRKYTYGVAKLTLAYDIKRAAEQACWAHFPPMDYKLDLFLGRDEIVSLLRVMLGDIQIGGYKISFDLETDKKMQIKSIAFAKTPDYSFYMPGEMIQNAEVCWLLSAVFHQKDAFITQNGSFDLGVLQDYGLVSNGTIYNPIHFDTMVAHHWLYAELPHDLHYLTSVYTDIPYYKWMGASEDEGEIRIYNCLDALATYRIADKLKEEMNAKRSV